MLADANGATRPLIAAQLARHGYRVVETATVEQTVAAAHAGVEAILLDTSLDGMNGWEILPLLRQVGPRSPHAGRSAERDERASPAELPEPGEGMGSTKPLEEDQLLGELARVLSIPGKRPACWWWKTTSTWRV